MDESEIIREAMRLLGRKRSERKTIACRLNAKRPRKRKADNDKPVTPSIPTKYT